MLVGCENACLLAVHVPTEIVEAPAAPGLTLYPVPVTHHVRLMMPEGRYRAELLAADGRVVLHLGTVVNGATLDLGGSAPGQYVVQLHGEGGIRLNARLVKQ